MKKKKLILLSLFAVIFSSCGTIFKGRSSVLTVNNGFPGNARVYYKDKMVGTSPCEVIVSKKGIMKGQQKIVLKADGYVDGTYTLKAKMRLLPLLGNVLISYGVTAIVDLVTGDFWEVVPLDYSLSKEEKVIINNVPVPPQDNKIQTGSNTTNELVKLQILNEEGILTTNEYSALRMQITEGNYNFTNSKADELNKFKKLYESKIISQGDMNMVKESILNENYNYKNSTYNQIIKFKDLRDNGMINEAEFTKKKKEIIEGN
jgi:hypothetical protein